MKTYFRERTVIYVRVKFISSTFINWLFIKFVFLFSKTQSELHKFGPVEPHHKTHLLISSFHCIAASRQIVWNLYEMIGRFTIGTPYFHVIHCNSQYYYIAIKIEIQVLPHVPLSATTHQYASLNFFASMYSLHSEYWNCFPCIRSV